MLTRDEAPNCKLVTLAAPVPRHHDAEPPRARRRPRHRRRPARAARTGRPARRPDARGARSASAVGSPRRSAASATSPSTCPTPPASTSSRTTTAASSTSARAGRCAGARAPTSPRARRAAGWPRWCGSPPRSRRSCAPPTLEAEVRELRLIAAHKPRYNRRSRNPGARDLAQAHRRAVPAALARARGARRRHLYFGPFGSHGARRRGARGAARGVPAPAVHPAAQPVAPDRARACSPTSAGAARPATAARTSRPTPRPRRALRAALVGDPASSSTTPAPGSRGSSAEERFEEAADRAATAPSVLLRAADRWQRASALAAVARARRRQPARRRRLGPRGRSATAGSPARRALARGAPPRPVVDALVATAETVEPGPGPLPALHRRGGRPPAALARHPGHPAGRAHRRLDLPRPGGRRPHGLARAARQSGARA